MKTFKFILTTFLIANIIGIIHSLTDINADLAAHHPINGNSNSEVISQNSIVQTKVSQTWTHPYDLTDNVSPDGKNAQFPYVAMDGNGNTIIVWTQSDGFHEQIFKSEFRNGNWTHPSNLNDNISPDGKDVYLGTPSSNRQVAMDKNGNAVIVWSQHIDVRYLQIFKSEYRNGRWTHPSDLNDYISPFGAAASPEVAMDNNGNAIVVWDQWDGKNEQIFKSEYRNGNWTHPSNLYDNISPNGSNAINPKVAMDNNGNAIIVWRQWDISGFKGNSQIFLSEYRDGNWTHPSDLSDSISLDGQNANLPNVAMDNNGNAIITWEQYDDGGVRQIFKSEFRNGNWKHPINFDDYINPSGGFFSTQPQVSMDNSNSAIIVWNQNVNGIQSLFKSEYRNGKWTHPSGLEDNFSPCGDHTNYPQVALDNNGNAIISWNQWYGSRKNIYKSEFRNGSWDHPNIDDYISPEGTKAYLSPQISMNKNADAIIVWVQYDSNDIKQIFFSEYRATPAQTPAPNMKSMPWIQLLLDD